VSEQQALFPIYNELHWGSEGGGRKEAGVVNLGDDSLGRQLLAGKWTKKMMIIHNNLMKGILLFLACLIAISHNVEPPRMLVPAPDCYITLSNEKCA
jgi:hypothetical protein